MQRFSSLYQRFPYFLPVFSGLLLVLISPPFNLWLLVPVVFVPLYFFILQEDNLQRIFVGVLFLGLIFSGYIFSITLAGFDWIPQAHLFSTLVKWLCVPIVLFISVVTALIIFLFVSTTKKRLVPLEQSVLFGTFALAEWLIGKAFMGFDYGSPAYPAVHIPALRFLASFGGTFLITFMIAFGSAAIAQALRFVFQRKKEVGLLFSLGIFSFIFIASWTYQYFPPIASTNAPSSVAVVVIQDSSRTESEAFGKIIHGSFTFPLLETHLKEASSLHPNIIIYPFSPWEGVIADRLDNSAFNKTDVIGMDFDIFGKWLIAHVPPETTLVTWNTRLLDGVYWNEIDFWRDGKLIGVHRKTHLFPFMDYTPQWSQDLGVYSLPYDGTAGTSTVPIQVGNTAIGNLVCSEVALPGVARENGKNADVLFAIGSEAMFSSPIPSEFNLLNAQLRAAETGRAVIRANKFGPSAYIDPRGNIVKELPRDESGILFVRVPTGTQRETTLYSAATEYPFLILLVGYSLFLVLRKPRLES